MNRPARLMIGLCALLSLTPIVGVIAWSAQEGSWLLFCSGLVLSSALILAWAMRAKSPVREHSFQPVPIAPNDSFAPPHVTRYSTGEDLLPPTIAHAHELSLPTASIGHEETLQEQQLLKEKSERLEKSLADCLEKQSQLIVELNSKNDEIQHLKKDGEELRNLRKQLQEQSEHHLENLKEELRQKDHLLEEYQQTIQKQQRQLAHLESKTRDLTYEIETLLMLNEGTSTKNFRDFYSYELDDELMQSKIDSVKTAGEADILLKRCMHLAQDLPNSSHCGSIGMRFRDVASDNDTLDLRRLFDRLRQEEGAIILFYSPQTEKLLFVHPSIKEVAGWSPEKFSQAFPDPIIGGIEEWKKQLAPLSKKGSVHIQLRIRSRSGAELNFNGCFSVISQGIFQKQVLGVLYKGDLQP